MMNERPVEYFNLYAYCISFIINLSYVSPTGTYPDAERAICAVVLRNVLLPIAAS